MIGEPGILYLFGTYKTLVDDKINPEKTWNPSYPRIEILKKTENENSPKILMITHTRLTNPLIIRHHHFEFENTRYFRRAIFFFWKILPPYFCVEKQFQFFLVDFRLIFWNYMKMFFVEILWFLAHLENPWRNSSWKLVMNISQIHRWNSTKLHYSQ